MISVQDITKTYRYDILKKPKRVLNGVSFEVNEGDLFGFIGPNGAGKSTTIKLILGLLKKEKGTISVLGSEKLTTTEQQQIGYLPEHPYFYDYLTGHELLAFYGALFGLRKDALESRIQELYTELAIDPQWANTPLKTYSKGMVQKIGLAQAIINKPKLLILDEPMSGLDPVARKQVRDLLLKLNAQGTTIFYSSHVLSDVETISNRVALLIDGVVRASGTIDELLNNGTESDSRKTLEELLLQEVSNVGN